MICVMSMILEKTDEDSAVENVSLTLYVLTWFEKR